MIYEDDGDGDIAPSKNNEKLNGAIGLPVLCKGCGATLCTLTHFCGYCGFKNLAFDHKGFVSVYNVTANDARKEMCTRHWHTLRVVSWTEQSPQAQTLRDNLAACGIDASRLRYCSHCGLELIVDTKAHEQDVNELIASIFE
ncbi:MAG: hypothetical protein G01um101448_475 [Parcubacteria group bacterium Gr01-1014_48]|nr:MAG: hypothetical protein Greene041614_697 [Parcubacteria group bacterium Greene0416_14]TSC73866.1 MAG: hypothetical protein G01um101448_475 [Parcubacteria group bacterium Gr01-1014_48]TSD01563.1 MAG: hypothetical protein Greene101415_143 [Parcubacteria group bacterium Greene1014_15]TSD08137.1 MAG: hypothetical protein Greene07144_372 [Parcubacteria group bacterium Greene0714_4]